MHAAWSQLLAIAKEQIHVMVIAFEYLVKVKKKNNAKTVYEQSCSTSDPKRSWSVKIYNI